MALATLRDVIPRPAPPYQVLEGIPWSLRVLVQVDTQ